MCLVDPVRGPVLRFGFVTEALTLLPPLTLPLGIVRVLGRGKRSGPSSFRRGGRRGLRPLSPFVGR